MPDLYYMDLSAPCRAVQMTAAQLGVELNLKVVNLFAQEQLQDSFLAINPQHVIPTLVDGDFKIWESRAICAYLVRKYGKDSKLYPSGLGIYLIDKFVFFERLNFLRL